MELILKQDVEGVGFADDIVTVKNGFGRNYLIPQGVAVLATPSQKKVLAETLKQRAYKEQKLVDAAQKTADALKGLEVKITSKVGSGDKLFGSVNNAYLAEEFAKHGHEVDKKFITVPGGQIKRLGTYTATVRLHRAVVASVDFDVIPEAS